MQESEGDSLNASLYDSFIITQHNAETTDRWSRSLIVEGIDAAQVSVLLLYVTNRAKGGGDIEDHQVDPDNRRVLLTFKDKQVAEHFLASGSISLLGTNHLVSRASLVDPEALQSSVTASAVKPQDSWEQICPMAEDNGKPIYIKAPSSKSSNDPASIVFVSDVPEALNEEKLKNLLESNDLADADEIQRVELLRDMKAAKITLFDSRVAAKICQRQKVNYKDKVLSFSLEPKEEVEEEEDDSDNVFESVFDTLKVTGVNISVSDEMLRLYFENHSRSGGGTISELSPLKNGECIVKFQDHKVASSVFQRQLHQLDGVAFSVAPLETVEATMCCAIEVDGLSGKHSEDLLRLYFESQTFGDATVEDVIIDRLRGKAVVTFKHHLDVERVLSHGTHVLSNVPLRLSRLDPSPPAPLLLEETEDKRLLAIGLPPRTKLSDLQKYFGKLSGGVRLRAAYHINNTPKCLVEFEAAPDYKQLRDLVHTKPFRGVMISVRKVPLTTSIEVLNVCDLSDEILTLFFENHQQGKGKVIEIRRQPDQGQTFIKFEKPDVIPGLLKKTLKLEGRTLIVHWHHSFLDVGSVPIIDPTIPGGKRFGSHKSLTHRLSRGMSLPTMSEHVEASQATSMRLSMMRCEEDESDITPTASLAELTVPEKMENLKPYHNKLLILIGFDKQLMSEATRTMITLNEVSLFGSEDLRASMKIRVLEKLMSVIYKAQHVSEVKGRLMKRDTVQEYVHSICLQRDIKATLASEPLLQVCAFDDKEIAKLESVLPSLIKELEFPFDVSTASAASLNDELKERQEEIEFTIADAEKKIRIVCLVKDESQIREFVEKFIREKCRVEKRIPVDQQRKDYIWQHRKDDLEPLKQDITKCGGSVDYEGGSVVLKGDSTTVNSCLTRLQEIINSLVEKSYTVDHPGGESFFTKTSPGKLILKGLESEDRAVVTVKSTTAPAQRRRLLTNRETAAEPDIVSSSATGAFSSSTSSSSSSSNDPIMARITNDGGIVITILTGTVESQKVNVVVNSTSKDLILDRGEISKSIFSTAGPSMQEDCMRRATTAFEYGEIFKTKGYNLPSKSVYHGAALEWDGKKGNSLQVLKSFIRNCLQQTKADGLKSIAFPAIGAGTLKIPADVVVKTLFEEVESFSQQQPATSLKDIRFVILAGNQHVAAAFKSKLDSLRSSATSCWRRFEHQHLKVNQTKTSLTILASSEKSANDVFRKIEDVLRDQTAEERIDSVLAKEAIGFLINDQIRRIEDLQSTHSVRISLEPSPPSNHFLLITGTPRDVASVSRLVRQIINNNP